MKSLSKPRARWTSEDYWREAARAHDRAVRAYEENDPHWRDFDRKAKSAYRDAQENADVG